MKIIVCAKQIRHTYARTGINPDENYLAEKDQLLAVNPFDESALDIALKIKKKLESVEIIILTLGPLLAEEQLRRLIALGGDQLVRIETEVPEDQFSSQSKAIFLIKAIKRLKGDLILCGKESLDCKSGQVGAFLAHELNLPFISGISDCKIDPQKQTAIVERKAGTGTIEVWNSELPAVFSVELNREPPGVSTLSARQYARRCSIETFYFDQRSDDERLTPFYLYPPMPRTRYKPAPDSCLSSFDRVQLLLTGSQIQKESEIIEGTATEQVRKVISFLKERKILQPTQKEK